ncbi:MAG: hypothetical protein JWQ87_1959 [Candidatus Sulfotelmatobacter sp.]|nr:hypothetical protein [Candidatus Sulfotelmatobacter sp.]
MTTRLQPEIEVWMVTRSSKIKALIDEGYAAAQRGELLELEEVRARLGELKLARLQQ